MDLNRLLIVLSRQDERFTNHYFIEEGDTSLTVANLTAPGNKAHSPIIGTTQSATRYNDPYCPLVIRLIIDRTLLH